MKMVNHYICEVCGTEYNEKAVCQNCENSHSRPQKFKNVKYIPFTQTGYTANGNYPCWVDIEFDDGMVKRYKR